MHTNYYFYREREQMKRAARIERLKALFYTLFFVGAVIIALSIVGTYETHYTMNGVVVASIGDEILVEDNTGNQWTFTGDGYIMGDKVRLTFFTNGTDSNRKDDEIVKVKVIDN